MKLTDIYSAKAVGMYWNTRNEDTNTAPYFGSTLFPSAKKNGLDLKFIKGKSGLPITLKPSAFDAIPDIRDRIGVKAIQTEMPFFREGFTLNETDRQEINRAKDAADPYIQPVLDNIYRDVDNLINGANVVPERMIMQLLSPADGSPKINISADGVVYDYDYDTDGSFKKNQFKKLTGTAVWTDYTNSDPISDIEDAQDYIERQTGVKPTILLLTKKTLKDIAANEKIKSYILAKAAVSGGAVRMTTGLVKQYLAEELGITCVVNEKKFIDETGTAKSFYPDNMATLLPAQTLGNTWYGTTPEESDLMSAANADVAIVNTGVAVTVITPPEIPVKTKTYASEIVLPSFEGMDMVFVISTSSDDGKLTVTTAEGTVSGKTAVTVTPALTSGNSYKYKTGASVTTPAVGDVCSSGYTNWDGSAEITATTGNTIVIVEVDAGNKAVKVGSATVAAKE